MPRIRSIKPEFFLDEDLAQLSLGARLVFIGLWTLADKEGRIEDRPGRIRVQLFPYEPGVAVEPFLLELHTAGFVIRYSGDDGRNYMAIRSFAKHQRPHHREADSTFPPPPRLAPALPGNAMDQVAETRTAGESPGSTRPGPGSSVPSPLDLDPDRGMGSGSGSGRDVRSRPGSWDVIGWYALERRASGAGNSDARPTAPSKGELTSMLEDMTDGQVDSIRATMREHFAVLSAKRGDHRVAEALANPTVGLRWWMQDFPLLFESVRRLATKPVSAYPLLTEDPNHAPATREQRLALMISSGFVPPGTTQEDLDRKREERNRLAYGKRSATDARHPEKTNRTAPVSNGEAPGPSGEVTVDRTGPDKAETG